MEVFLHFIKQAVERFIQFDLTSFNDWVWFFKEDIKFSLQLDFTPEAS